ncbi:hypothetical protein F511_11544 [Dorcoceras hygrometricum]|uniref:Uncharacterized protein n=1 Tax=Dorcoceras hygrometricum TaxID=472368 RepID=A0A2Z7ABJ3_9LAMI|nr:hypothetical protein F511_11544 [Dorcoceras hygrometricum]
MPENTQLKFNTPKIIIPEYDLLKSSCATRICSKPPDSDQQSTSDMFYLKSENPNITKRKTNSFKSENPMARRRRLIKLKRCVLDVAAGTSRWLFSRDLLPADLTLRRRFDKLERCRFGVFSCECLFGYFCWFLTKGKEGLFENQTFLISSFPNPRNSYCSPSLSFAISRRFQPLFLTFLVALDSLRLALPIDTSLEARSNELRKSRGPCSFVSCWFR